jgi:hypothetical protein
MGGPVYFPRVCFKIIPDETTGCRGHFSFEYQSESFWPLKASSAIHCPFASAIWTGSLPADTFEEH